MAKKAKKKKRNIPQRRPAATDSSTITDIAAADPVQGWSLGPRQIGVANYLFLLTCITAQVLTFWISWPTWESRPLLVGTTPNVPWLAGTPQFSTGVLLIGSLFLAALSPKKYGLAIHLGILAVSIFMDQFRCQPQILAIAFMMSACVWTTARRLCLWYLIAMWTWAGIHKFLSPDWFGYVTCYLLSDLRGGLANVGIETEFNPSHHYKKFAAVVAVSEIATGLVAWFRPKLGAIACVALHIGIACFLILVNWNFSVLPWNATTAMVGGWLFWTAGNSQSNPQGVVPQTLDDADQADQRPTEKANGFLWFTHARVRLPQANWGKCVVMLMLVVPVGFYFGWVRHSLSHSLYSNNLPLGMISRTSGHEILDCWDELRVPFPNVDKTYQDYFRLTGETNDKLHVRAMMLGKSSRYFVHHGNQKILEIDEGAFFDENMPGPHGVGIDNPRKVFELEVAGAKMLKREVGAMVYAVKFQPEYFSPEHLELLVGLPNLEQIQLGDCNLTDPDMKRLPVLRKLKGIGIGRTSVTDAGILVLKKQPMLNFVQFENSAVTDEGVQAVIGRADDE